MILGKVHGINKLKVKLKEMPKEMQREVQIENKSSLQAIEYEYKRQAKEHFITGNFDASIYTYTKDGWLSGRAGSSSPVAVFLELGTEAHFITPIIEPGALRFFFEKIGIKIFTRFVQHPGTPAYNLLIKAWIIVMEPFDTKYYKRLKKRFESIGNG